MSKMEDEYYVRKKWRADVFKDTKKKIEANKDEYFRLAQENLERFAKKAPLGHRTVLVIQGDCLEAAADIVRTYGVKPAVLNMANMRHMGGGVKKGSGAQEENMFRRTTCYLNRSSGILGTLPTVFEHGDTYTDLFEEEVYGVSTSGVVPIFDAVCFKQEEAMRYADRPTEDIFPFYELRSAAQQLRDHADPFDEALCEQQIRAQFRTLDRMQIRAVVLSAFGCGAYKNPPEQVAAIYKRVIDDLKDTPLKRIVFAMIDPNKPGGDPGQTLQIFKHYLDPPKRARSETMYFELPDGLIPMKYHQEVAYAAAMSHPEWEELTIEGGDIGLRGKFFFKKEEGTTYMTDGTSPFMMIAKNAVAHR